MHHQESPLYSAWEIKYQCSRNVVNILKDCHWPPLPFTGVLSLSLESSPCNWRPLPLLVTGVLSLSLASPSCYCPSSSKLRQNQTTVCKQCYKKSYTSRKHAHCNCIGLAIGIKQELWDVVELLYSPQSWK